MKNLKQIKQIGNLESVIGIKEILDKDDMNTIPQIEFVSTPVAERPKYTYDAYVLYYRYAGEKKAVLLNNKTELQNKLEQLRRNRRKFLGFRKVKLSEI